MPKDKSTGKKLADMMYGNPDRAAFGITPMIGKRREDRQDREAAKSFPVDLARGVVAGAVGLPGDIESLARLPYELISGNESPTFLPTSEDVLKRIPFGTNTPAGQFASGLGTLAGGSAPIGPAVSAAKALPGALKTAARNLSTPRTMSPEAGAVRIGGAKDVLSPEEREENLQKFLGNSRIRERLYHATPKDFKAFKPGGDDPTLSGPAIWLTPDATKQPAAHNIGGGSRGFVEGTNVMPVYAQARSPLMLDDRLSIEWAREVFADGSREFPDLISQKTIDELKSSGYDSIIHADPYGNRDGEQEIIMFEPNKIKSAIGNRGTYDIEEADITKAQGGAVSFSDNPDVMALELQAGGLVKGLKAAAKAVKPAEAPMKASEALGRIEGRPLVITQADRTKVGGGYLGGPGFSGLQLEDPAYRAAEAAWAVKNPGTAKMILGGRGDSKDAVYAAMLGTPTQHQSNQMVFDKLLGDFKKAAKKGGLDPELRDRINMRLANSVDKDGNNIFPPDVDILDKNFKDLASTFDRRSVTANLIGGMGVGGKKGQIIDYDKIIRQTTDPMLLESPTGALGNRLFTLSGGIIERPDLHPAFPTIMQGEDLGVSFSPVARDLIMKDFTEKTMREKGRAPGIFDYTRGYPPSQLITEDILTEMQKLGLKKGGAVRMAGGGEVHGLSTADLLFLQSQEDLGKLPAHAQREAITNMGGQEVRQRMAGKMAAGGEITADDLILEERKL